MLKKLKASLPILLVGCILLYSCNLPSSVIETNPYTNNKYKNINLDNYGPSQSPSSLYNSSPVASTPRPNVYIPTVKPTATSTPIPTPTPTVTATPVPTPTPTLDPFHLTKPNRTTELTISPSKAIQQVSDKFLSFSVDSTLLTGGYWWSTSNSLSLKARRDKINPYDFMQIKLINLAKNLSPAYFRIGGTEADKTYYDVKKEYTDTPPANYSYLLTKTQWDQINTFAKNASLSLMFTLNAGSSTRDTNGNWTVDNAKNLLEYSEGKNYSIPVWELGHEINAYGMNSITSTGNSVSAAQYALDIKAAKTLIDEYYSSSLLAGPSSIYYPSVGEIYPVLNRTVNIMDDFLKEIKNDIDIVSWHYYPTQSDSCVLTTRKTKQDYFTFTSINTIFDEALEFLTGIQTVKTEYSPDSKMWLTETGSALCGGQDGISNKFVTGFWWLDMLGSMAKNGQEVVIRDSLVGGENSLIDSVTLKPRPDYWNSIMWKKFMGKKVLNVDVPSTDTLLRSYAQCTPTTYPSYKKGSITVLAINTSDKSVRLTFNGITSTDKEAYRIRTNYLLGENVLLNDNKVLALDENNALPDIEPQYIDEDYVDLLGQSYAFVVFPNANASVCK